MTDRSDSMSVKIKVSYTEEHELAGVIRLLSPVIKSYKVQPEKGRYKRAYIDAGTMSEARRNHENE